MISSTSLQRHAGTQRLRELRQAYKRARRGRRHGCRAPTSGARPVRNAGGDGRWRSAIRTGDGIVRGSAARYARQVRAERECVCANLVHAMQFTKAHVQHAFFPNKCSDVHGRWTTSGHDRGPCARPRAALRLDSSPLALASLSELHAARAHGHEPKRAALASAWDCSDYPPNPNRAPAAFPVGGGAVRRHVRLRGFYWNGWSKGCGNAPRGTTFEPGAGDSFYLTPSVAACRMCSRCMCPAYVF